ncbi:MAG: hypothetical protein HQL58_12730 [Magnetococcales bacterium]|nr:hypothetical protein [Magnetococcales bacterium]
MASSQDKAFMAASFARRLIQEGEQPSAAIYKAANYYRVAVAVVASHMDEVKSIRNKPRR